MQLYWRLRDIPELRPLSDSDRKEVMAITAGRRLRDPVLLLYLIPLLILVGIGNLLGDAFLPFRFGSSIGGGIMGGLGAGLFTVVSYGRGRHHLAAEIERRGLAPKNSNPDGALVE